MESLYIGFDYSYLIGKTNSGKKFYFDIIAKSHQTKKQSTITNLNFILSEFGIELNEKTERILKNQLGK